MDTIEHVTQILERNKGAVLEKSRFGRSELGLFWIATDKIQEVARTIKGEAGFDFLENLNGMQVEENLVITYFVRKTETDEMIVLRISAEVGFSDDWVELDSVSSVWQMAQPMEAELSRLFGVKIPGQANVKEWDGFPLRKSFVQHHGGVAP